MCKELSLSPRPDPHPDVISSGFLPPGDAAWAGATSEAYGAGLRVESPGRWRKALALQSSLDPAGPHSCSLRGRNVSLLGWGWPDPTVVVVTAAGEALSEVQLPPLWQATRTLCMGLFTGL